MKKIVISFSVCFIFMVKGMIFAQDDGSVPYFSDNDIIAIETVIPEEKLFELQENQTLPSELKTVNEMNRLNASHPIYHLLVLDRVYCPDSDISDTGSMQILYKYRHGRNGYLVLLYVPPADGPVFPQLPARSRIILNLLTVSPNIMSVYINSSVFRRYVSSPAILTQLQEALRKN